MKYNSVFLMIAASILVFAAAPSQARDSRGQFAALRRASAEAETPQALATPQGDSPLQAICREVVVETDEGYGVSSHETRYVCETAH